MQSITEDIAATVGYTALALLLANTDVLTSYTLTPVTRFINNYFRRSNMKVKPLVSKENLMSLEWHTLFEILLQGTHAPFSITGDGDDIIINSDESGITAISKRLQTVLAASENFHHFLPYQVSQSKRPELVVVDQQTLSVPEPMQTAEEGLRIFGNVFGEVAHSIAFMHEMVFGAEATVENGILWSKEHKLSKAVKGFWTHAIETLLSSCDGITAEKLRVAWLGGESQLVVPEGGVEDFHMARGLLQTCIGYRTSVDQEGIEKTKFFFDFMRMYQLIFPPKIEVQQLTLDNSDGFTHAIRVNQDHFSNTLRQLNNHGMLFQIYRSAEDAAIKVDPLFLSERNVARLQTLHVLVLDCSGSMSSYISGLTDRVLEYIKKLPEHDNTARIKIVPFNNDRCKAGEFHVSSMAEIERFVRSLDASGGTELYKSVDEELSDLREQSVNYNIKMVVFTDGYDNNPGHWARYSQSVSANIEALNESGRLQLIPIGAGNPDTSALSAMAHTCHTEYKYFNSPDDLEHVFDDIGQSSKATHNFIDFMVRLRESERDIRMSVPQDGNPYMPQISFPMLPDEQMVVQQSGSNELAFRLLNANEIPDASLVDKLRTFKRLANDVALSQEEKAVRIKKLERIIDDISSVPAKRQSENLLIANAKIEVQDYVNRLSRAQNQHELASAMSFFRAQAGMATMPRRASGAASPYSTAHGETTYKKK